MRVSTVYLFVAACMSSASSFSQEQRKVDAFHCARISNEIARLECYDTAYADFRAAAKSPGSWFTQTEIDPFDDTVTTFVGLNAEEPGNPLSGRVQLVIRCKGNELSAWIAWKGRMGNDSPLIRSRIGDEEARTDQWLLSTSTNSAFYPHEPQEFVQDLMAADRFVAQLSSGLREGELATFNIRGLEKAAKPIEEPCLKEPEVELPREGESRLEFLLRRGAESMDQ